MKSIILILMILIGCSKEYDTKCYVIESYRNGENIADVCSCIDMKTLIETSDKDLTFIKTDRVCNDE